MREKVLYALRLSKETLWTVSQMLQARLEQHGECQFVGMGGDVRML